MKDVTVIVHREDGATRLGSSVRSQVAELFEPLGVRLLFRDGEQGFDARESWSGGELGALLEAHRTRHPVSGARVHLYVVRWLRKGRLGLMFDRDTSHGAREACAIASGRIREQAGPSSPRRLFVREVAHELGHTMNLCHRAGGVSVMVPRRAFGPDFMDRFELRFEVQPGTRLEPPGTKRKFRCVQAADGDPSDATLRVSPWADGLLPGEPLVLQVHVHAEHDCEITVPSLLQGTAQVLVNGALVPWRHLACGAAERRALRAGEQARFGLVVPGVQDRAPLLEWHGAHQIELVAEGLGRAECTLQARYPQTVWELDLVRALLRSGARHDALGAYHARRLAPHLVAHDRPALTPLRRAAAALLPSWRARLLDDRFAVGAVSYDPNWED